MTCKCKSHAGTVAANISYAAVSELRLHHFCNSSSLLFCANCVENFIFNLMCLVRLHRVTRKMPDILKANDIIYVVLTELFSVLPHLLNKRDLQLFRNVLISV